MASIKSRTVLHDWCSSLYLLLFFYFLVFYGSWFDHVLGWWKHKDDPNILFLKYGEMKKVTLLRPVGTGFHHFPAHILWRINTTPFFSSDTTIMI